MEKYGDIERSTSNFGHESLLCQLSTNWGKNSSDKNPKTAISLFSGGGGLDLGVERAGFKTLACIEKDAHCCETLRFNQSKYFRSAEIVNEDVDNVDVQKLMKSVQLKRGALDLLFGGPPCQSFSQIGKQDGINDARGLLLFAMVKYAKVLNPKVILIENVRALATAKGSDGQTGGILQSLLSQLEALGYQTHTAILNAADYGVAQLRKRLFVVAFRSDVDFEFPSPEFTKSGKNPYSTVGQVISGLPLHVEKGETPLHPNHIDVTPKGDIRRISHVSEGAHLAKMHNAPPEIKGRLSQKDTTKFLRLSRFTPSNTLRCGEIFFHPLENRYLTPREYMRVQGFPDDYQLMGPIRGRSGTVKNLDQHRQVANSVPPLLAEQVAKSILAAMSAKRGKK